MDIDAKIQELYRDFLRPLPSKLFKILKLDKIYTKASGNYLFYRQNNSEVKVLDLVGGYGSLILGHNHPEIIQYAAHLLTKQVPIHAQMSVRSKAARLGNALNDEISRVSRKEYVVTFANSGTEAVEGAVKHAYLTCNSKIEKAFKTLEQTLSNIEMSLKKLALNPKFVFKGDEFTSFQSFKKRLLEYNRTQVNAARPILLASKGSFHGKTLGALSLTDNKKFREPFVSFGQIGYRFFEWKEEQICEYFNEGVYHLLIPELTANHEIRFKKIRLNAIVGVIIEPIQGEGGVFPVPQWFLKFLREITGEFDVPLIFDEIQCGFYRTGDFLASFRANVFADYYILGKSLGGGIAKISALMIDKDHYLETFGLVHTSTFAEDEFSSGVALKALELAKKQAAAILSQGHYFKERLQNLHTKYPEIITGIRGEGLMLGITFKDFRLSQSYGFQVLSRSGYFNYLLSGYLLNEYDIRTAPLLSSDTTLRIQPSAFITTDEIDRFLHSISILCQILFYEDLYQLISFTLDKEYQKLRVTDDYRLGEIEREDVNPKNETVGFLTHYIDTNTVKAADPSLNILSEEAILQLLENLLPISEPIILNQKNVENINGKTISIIFVGLPFTSGMARQALKQRQTEGFQRLCQKAVDMLHHDFGVSIVGLGQYTSILTNNGCSVSNPGVGITTGNSFTVYIGVQAVLDELKEAGLATDQLKLGVIGAGGNISSVYAQFFTGYAAEIYLLGSDSRFGYHRTVRAAERLLENTLKKLLDGKQPQSPLEKQLTTCELYRRIKQDNKRLNDYNLWQQFTNETGEKSAIKVTTDLKEIYDCHVVVVATNSSEPFLKPEHFKHGTIVYDISVPLNCTPELIDNKKGIKVIMGGIAALPNKEKLSVKGLPIDDGYVFGCMGETILLGMEGHRGNFSQGTILPQQVELIGRIGAKHGFLFVKPKIEPAF